MIGKFCRELKMSFFVNFDPFTADTPFSQLKISEIGGWLGRRNKSPQAFAAACSRTFWRWQHKYCQTKRVGVAPFFQFAALNMVFFYIINHNRISKCD